MKKEKKSEKEPIDFIKRVKPESKLNKLETRFNDFYRYVITIVTKKPWYKFW